MQIIILALRDFYHKKLMFMKTVLYKTLILLFLLSFNAQFVVAQTTIPNGGFENWQNVGSDTEEPTNWNSNKTGGGFANLGPQTLFRDADAYAGSFCAKIETQSTFGTAVNGTMTTGKIEAPSLSPSDGYIHTVRAEADFNSPFTGRPDSIVGYYKYMSVNGDMGKISFALHGDYDVENPDQGGSAPFIIGEAEFLTPATDVTTWTRFSLPVTYSSPDSPFYILAIVTSSSAAGTAQQGSILMVDEFEAIYNPPPPTATLDFGSLSPGGPYDITDALGASVTVALSLIHI